MCGIAGIFGKRGALEPAWIKLMADTLRHRGPDDEGYLAVLTGTGEVAQLVSSGSQIPGQDILDFDKAANLLLGHRRLSILDPAPSGHQPMQGPGGRTWGIFNGEIYNYIELKDELKLLGYSFATGNDTEVLLAAYEQWGEGCIDRFNGMWAFAVYDANKNILFGARDRFGVKPFYYYLDSSYFAFASEAKALVRLPFVKTGVNTAAVFDYFFLSVEEYDEESFFQNIYELKPSMAFRFDFNTGRFQKWQYYTLLHEKQWRPFDVNEFQECAMRIRELLMKAVDLRLRSDVPVGSCLSGGIDSSSIVCAINRLLQSRSIAQIGGRLNVFTACYRDAPLDESHWAGTVAHATGASWHKVFPSAQDFFKDMEDIVYAQDFPFGSTSIYAQYSVARLASETGIKVLLDGQGGDELFAGYISCYPAYFAEMLKNLQLRALAAEWEGLGNSPATAKFTAAYLVKLAALKLLPGRIKQALYKNRKYNGYLSCALWEAQKHRVLMFADGAPGGLNEMLYWYMTKVRLKSLLRYEDRNSMRFSLEARAPFADDTDLIEYVFRLPASYKIREGWSKSLLRHAVRGLLPEEIRRRKDKIAFATPEYQWLNLKKDETRELLNNDLDDFMDTGRLKLDWENLNLSQPKSGETHLWRFINFALWKRVYGL